MISKRLKELRIKAGLTQNDVAKILNISRSAYAYYESSKRQLNYESLKALSDYYQVSMDYLFGRTEVAQMYTLSPDDFSLLEKYQRLDLRGKQTIQALIESEARYGEKSNRLAPSAKKG